MKRKIGTAMVVGAGISGIRSALDLAEAGYGITLIDKAPHIGGILSQLDYQFPTDRCGMCKMLPLVNRDASSQYCLRKGLFHENIDILLATELVAAEGSPGSFNVTLRQQPAWIDKNLCTGCGKCVEKCPEEISDSFNLGLARRKAIYLPVPHNIPNTYVIDFEACTKCGDCVDVCPAKAIQIPEQTSEPIELEMEVGTVVLNGGTAYFDPATGKNTYGYGTFPNVVTSREFERILSGTGPNRGSIVRPSDGKPARKVAWLQCVGSRDVHTNSEYCSSVCCMHAIKEARLAKNLAADELEAAIFYMDMRTFGKSFQRYRDQAEGEQGIRFERSRVHSVTQKPGQEDLSIIHVNPDGTGREENFDMVVLSVGQRPSVGTKELAETLQVPLNQWGFCRTEPFAPALTSREGIVVGGSFAGLKDIGESVIQAGSAALSASRAIAENGGNAVVETAAEEVFRDVSKEQPRILVAICICGETLPQTFDREQLRKCLAVDPAVDQVVFLEQTCTIDGWETLAETAKNSRPNRILLGACLPHLYDRKFKEMGSRIGLDPALAEVVDIRTSGISQQADGSNGWIESVLKAGISRIKRVDPAAVVTIPINQNALVIGGGIGGMTAALAVAEHGFPVDLVEREETLGGNLTWLRETLDGNQTAALLKEMKIKVE
ncbi:MAG: FAD-dependent oxidoreductase, partial [Proteobacteria bacterium]|nr:FAD-dependent oxidoreductase [Pseudomonadota bacterium]